MPGYGTTGGKHAGDTESPTISTRLLRIAEQAVEAPSWRLHAGPPHRRGLAARSLSENPEGRCDRNRRPDSNRVRGESGGEPAVAAEQFKSGTYRAPPVRRVYIPKADGPDAPATSAYLPSRTKFCRGQSPWCWRQSTSRISWTARTASDRMVGPSGAGSAVAGVDGDGWGRGDRSGHQELLRHR